MNQMPIPSVNRTYKARMFERIYDQKEVLLELYNGVNLSNYDDPDLLEINTLENAIYMSMHNDVSFIIDSRLSLYEHQSTYDPNLPLRYLMYISDLYSVITKDMNLYGSKIVQIPPPRFISFYNGPEDQPDRQVLKLSDAYMVPEQETALELEVLMLNINRGHNPELMKACKTLRDYAEYTARVRDYAKNLPIQEAVERTITECIQEDILAEFLRKNRAEAISVSIYEYDEERTMRQLREEAWDIGHEEGREEGLKEGFDAKLLEIVQRKLAKGLTVGEIADFLEEDEAVLQKLLDQAGQPS